MIPYEKHVLICTNRRDPQNPKGSCETVERRDLAPKLIARLRRRGG